METRIELKQGWKILQDVHDTGEKTGLYAAREADTSVGSQVSEWEELEELKHLQLIYARQPYFGRELRYFNQAPWWYKTEFEVPDQKVTDAVLKFTNVDYYGKVWLNGEFLGEHEGYSAPFSFNVKDKLVFGKKNYLIVKVSSPWDDEVELDAQDSRTTLVKRNMVKGTYEHSDTFIQRDVNPVGIYGKVELILTEEGVLEDQTDLKYELDPDVRKADVYVETEARGLKSGETYDFNVKIREKESGLIKAEKTVQIMAEKAETGFKCELKVEDVRLWSTWDHGYPWMYQAELTLSRGKDILSSRTTNFAFRDIQIERNEKITRFWLNNRKLYIRGTSYFPDCYISAMTRERYLRDLLNVKAAGFNLVRVHVHTEQEVFYDLCDELGIAVFQDSEYNWTHPSTDEWAQRFADVYRENVKLLKHHPSLICWIIMNEPGCIDPDGNVRRRFMEENPGPALYREVQKMDPGRPIIKGSFCEDDPLSGDSHNYLGSLSGGEYADIYEQTEKLNTEYGFDAPGSSENLKTVPAVYHRLEKLVDDIPKIQEYQYKLLKYYTEHYRIQKYEPCSGYVQFMFIDLCPQSFYGLYDWWGIPKKGLQAILESNAPVGVLAKHKDHLDSLYIVNDTDGALGECELTWIITETLNGELVEKGSVKAEVPADSRVMVKTFEKEYGKGKKWNLTLILSDNSGKCMAKNTYQDICTLLSRVDGHPDRMSHEFGMRLYWA